MFTLCDLAIMILATYYQIYYALYLKDELLCMCAIIHLIEIVTLIVSAIGVEICPYSYRTYDKNATFIVYISIWLIILPFLIYSMYDVDRNYNEDNSYIPTLSIVSNIFNLVYLSMITFFDIGHRIYDTIKCPTCKKPQEKFQRIKN